ncbi:hypothetical protein APSETT444_004901 [Aspergillus pseudonomiae]
MFTTLLHEQKYFALSYVWGEDTPSNPITINGHSVPVTENLFDFLLHYRDLTEVSSTWELADMFFWVDAICINQEDIPEKNSQVLQMSSIYRSADAVLSWLGVEADDSDYTIEVMIDIAGKIAASLDKDDPLSWMAPSQTELWQRNSDSYGMGNKFWKEVILDPRMDNPRDRACKESHVALWHETVSVSGLGGYKHMDNETSPRS